MAKASAKNKAANTPLFTLESLQEAARRVGAPPLGDTPSAREAVEYIIDFQDSCDFFRRENSFERALSARNASVFDKFAFVTMKLYDLEEEMLSNIDPNRLTHLTPIGVDQVRKQHEHKIEILLELKAALSKAAPLFFSLPEITPGKHDFSKLPPYVVLEIFNSLRAAWEENGQLQPSASKTYKTIGASLLKVGIEVSDVAIKKAVKTAEIQEKSGY